MQEFTIDLKNYKTDGTVFKRAAVRGMIRRDGKFLLIHGMKYGDYKFPGGGKHEEEALLDTLVREVAEETGYRIKRESVEEFMKVTERRKGDPDDLMEMVSWYYVWMIMRRNMITGCSGCLWKRRLRATKRYSREKLYPGSSVKLRLCGGYCGSRRENPQPEAGGKPRNPWHESADCCSGIWRFSVNVAGNTASE